MLTGMGRAVLLDRWITHMQEADGVWLATCNEVSTWWRQNNMAIKLWPQNPDHAGPPVKPAPLY
ncbi:polysaccharide deacetylase [Paenarthrobacter nicotinovorans]|jgi:hypothetical protein|nr:polysaccharide deacetylase [Paenarthrobacter nicotinovorans]